MGNMGKFNRVGWFMCWNNWEYGKNKHNTLGYLVIEWGIMENSTESAGLLGEIIVSMRKLNPIVGFIK